MNLDKKIILLLCLFFHDVLYAELTIRITQGVGKQTPIAIVPFGADKGVPLLSVDIAEIITNDLMRSGRFSPNPSKEYATKSQPRAQRLILMIGPFWVSKQSLWVELLK